MQIKKNPRDDGYPESSEYEDAQGARTPAYDVSGETVSRGRRDAGEATAEPAATRAEAPAARTESIVDADSSFDGRYETSQDLRILGSISGEVVCRGILTIERDASAKARIQARDAQIRGRVEGDIVCTGRLLLTSTAVVSGTFKAATLLVEEGASVSGTVQTTPAPSAVEAMDAPTPLMAVPTEKEPAAEAAAEGAPGRSGGSSRWTSRSREVPSFALVSSEERTVERN